MRRKEAHWGTRWRSVVLGAVVAAALTMSLTPGVNAYPRPGDTVRVSVTTEGRQAQRQSEPPPGITSPCRNYCKSAISANGRFVAFESMHSDLVEGDRNEALDIFVRDLRKGTTERVSISSEGNEGVGLCGAVTASSPPRGVVGSYAPSIAASGRFVVFSSCAANLVAGDTNGAEDIFIHDRKVGQTKLVSVTSEGAPALCVSLSICNKASTQAISADGRYVAFLSPAPNLVGNDANGFPDAFVKDLHTGSVELVSVASDGTQGDFNVVTPPRISADGRVVAFRATSDNLDERDTNILDYGDVFVHDRESHKTELINITVDGAMEHTDVVKDFNGHGGTGEEVAISSDGRFVAFVSRWGGYVPNDSNDTFDIFVKDRNTQRIERISVMSDGREGSAYAEDNMSITPNGRFVAFVTEARLAPDDRRGGTCKGYPPLNPDSCPAGTGGLDNDMYVYDRDIGAIDLISRDFEGGVQQCADPSAVHCPAWRIGWPAIDATGRSVAFSSYGDRLIEGDTNEQPDTFVRDRGLPLYSSGTGGGSASNPSASDDRICITPDLCLPPDAVVSSLDEVDDVGGVRTRQGADLRGAALAYRAKYQDLFVSIELDDMPQLSSSVLPIFHGLRFEFEERIFEVRASSLFGGTFGLFDCTDGPICTKAADLSGGYGTTGMRVVFSLPMDAMGLRPGGTLGSVEAFSGLGTFHTGATRVLDRVRIDKPTESGS